MRSTLTHARAAAVLACLGLPGLVGVSAPALAQAKKPAPAAAPAPAPAPAGQAAPAAAPQGPVKVELKGAQADWTKVCGKDQGNGKEICYTTRDFGTDPSQPPAIAVAIYDVKGDDQKIVRLLMPVGLLLRPGFRFSMDKGPQTEGNFEICMPNGCFAEAKVKTATIDTLKKATLLNVAVKNSANVEVDFSIPMEGFGKAFDGAPIDPKELQKQQEELAKQLEEKAQKERALLEQQKAGAATPPATPAPAPAPAK